MKKITPPNMDFIAYAKANGTHFTDTCKTSKTFQTPSNSRPADGQKGDKYNYKGPELWRHPVNPVATPNTHTKPGGSRRAGDKSD